MKQEKITSCLKVKLARYIENSSQITQLTVLPNSDILLKIYHDAGNSIYVLDNNTLDILYSDSISDVECGGMTLDKGMFTDISIKNGILSYKKGINGVFSSCKYDLNSNTNNTMVYDPEWENDFQRLKNNNEQMLYINELFKEQSQFTNFYIAKLQPNLVVACHGNSIKVLDITLFRNINNKENVNLKNKKLEELQNIKETKNKILSEISMFTQKIEDAKKTLGELKEKSDIIKNNFYKINR